MATHHKVGRRPGGQLERSLITLARGPLDAERDRRRGLRSTKSGPKDQMVHLEITGEAVDGWGYADAPVTWEHPFLYTPLQSSIPFKTPHLTAAHPEFTAGVNATLVLMQAQVVGWLQNGQGWFIGAKVRVATAAPGQSDPIAYSAVLHLTFTGNAYPTDEELGT